MTSMRVREVYIFTPEQLPAKEKFEDFCLPQDHLHEFEAKYGHSERQLSFWPYFNISTVPQLSPFRYAGGKTWFMPILRTWLSAHQPIREFIEPFAGGGVASLTA